MCGRYAATKDPATLAAEFDALDAVSLDPVQDAVTDAATRERSAPPAPRIDYNVAPTKNVVTVVQRHPRDGDGNVDPDAVERSLRMMRWGLVPNWAKEKSIGAKMINARSESAATKPAFRTSLARRRCLIPADGWYEWRRDGKEKQPFYMTTPDGSSLAMAGLWSVWHDKEAPEDAPPLITCAVLTTEALGQLADIHNRMPMLMTSDQWAGWLDPDEENGAKLLAAPSMDLVESLELRPISALVNNVRNNGPELLERVDPNAEPVEQALFGGDSG